ncbi:hypothetical protein CRUP_011324 [Coryphaenoides rupestris]|nr:hypothetical protein CRUP_011324 [Coryphaenoides rupestris]
MRSIVGLVFVVGAATLYLYLLSTYLPVGPRRVTYSAVRDDGVGQPEHSPVPPEEHHRLKFPSDLEELRQMATLLRYYKTEHTAYILLLFSSAYLHVHSLVLSPHAATQNILAGAIFGPYEGLLLACVLTTVGSTMCYLLSQAFGKRHITRLFPDKVAQLQKKVLSHDPQLVPQHVRPHRLLPYNFICVQTGAVLSEVSSLDDLFTWQRLLQLLAIACVALLPGALIRRHQVRLTVLGPVERESNGLVANKKIQ